jgi:transposase
MFQLPRPLPLLAGKETMSYRIAAIDVHKRMLMVAVATAGEEVEDPVGEALEFECRRFGTGEAERGRVVAWLRQRGAQEIVMESTAQYWQPIWLELEPHFAKLHLAQAQSNRAPRGRKNDFRDAKRLARRLLAGELMLSFVPDAEQRMWRSVTRYRHQLLRDRVRLQNRLEALLEEMRIKLSSVVSELRGLSARRILEALAQGETDAEKLAGLGDWRLRCSREQLADALRGSPSPLQREILGLYLKQFEQLDGHLERLAALTAQALSKHQDAVLRVAEIPGFGPDSAQRLIAEVGADAATFPSADEFASWVGVCPGSNISAEQNQSARSPKGNRFVRHILTQAAHAAVRTKGCFFQALFHRFLPRLQYPGAIWAVAHRLARVVWKILHDGVSYLEKGAEPAPSVKKRRAKKMIRALRKMGYDVAITPAGMQPAISPVP